MGDVVAATGFGNDDASAGLKRLLESHRGHLEVSESGELLYSFHPKLIERGTEPLLARLKRTVGGWLEKGFKAWIVVMLVVYFVVFVVLMLAALTAGKGDRRGGGWGGGRGRRGGIGMPGPNLWFWYWIWGPRWYLGRPYYGRRWERTLPKDDTVPFYKKVFAFVFGPDRPRPTRKQLDRSTLRLLRARSGVLTTAELVEHTGLTFDRADEEMARLVGAYGGEPWVSPRGEIAYAFPELMTSAHGRVEAREPNPAWMRLEYPLELTGNTGGSNALIAGMNGFNLLAAATAPWFIFPRLGIGGPVAVAGLIVIPVVFSALFFAVPLFRSFSIKLENRRRAARNIRRVLLGRVYGDALGPALGVTVEEALADVRAKLAGRPVSRAAVDAELQRLAAELDAEVTPDPDGALRYAFPAVRRAFEAGEAARRTMRLEERTPGNVVFSTADTSVEASEREGEAFDRELAAAGADVGQYLPPTDRVAFEADWECVAFDEELAQRGSR